MPGAWRCTRAGCRAQRGRPPGPPAFAWHPHHRRGRGFPRSHRPGWSAAGRTEVGRRPSRPCLLRPRRHRADRHRRRPRPRQDSRWRTAARPRHPRPRRRRGGAGPGGGGRVGRRRGGRCGDGAGAASGVRGARRGPPGPCPRRVRRRRPPARLRPRRSARHAGRDRPAPSGSPLRRRPAVLAHPAGPRPLVADARGSQRARARARRPGRRGLRHRLRTLCHTSGG